MSCLEPDAVKHSYINIAAPSIAAFIEKYRTCQEDACDIM